MDRSKINSPRDIIPETRGSPDPKAHHPRRRSIRDLENLTQVKPQRLMMAEDLDVGSSLNMVRKSIIDLYLNVKIRS